MSWRSMEESRRQLAAAAAGLRTAFIARPNEHGRGKGESSAAVPVDLSAASLEDLTDRLGCA